MYQASETSFGTNGTAGLSGLTGVDTRLALNLGSSRYILRTARELHELREVLTLRERVFREEYGRAASPTGLDFDAFDHSCEHLAVFERATDRIVGTYRLLDSERAKGFYSETEFEMDQVLRLPGRKLELGRACIDPDHRNGAVLALLWKGLLEAASELGASVLFGCSSIKTTELWETALLVRYFKRNGHYSADLNARAHPDYRMSTLEWIERTIEDEDLGQEDRIAAAWIPPLLTTYLRAGAKIVGEPALDRDFRCIDFLTVLSIDQLTGSYRRRFASC